MIVLNGEYDYKKADDLDISRDNVKGAERCRFPTPNYLQFLVKVKERIVREQGCILISEKCR